MLDQTPAPSSSAPDQTTPAASSTAVQTAPDAPSAAPSPAPVDDRAELLKVVQQVVQTSDADPGAETPPASDPATPNETRDPDQAKDTAKQDPDADAELLHQDEYKALKPRTRKAFDRLRGQLRDARATLDAVRPQAEAFQRLHEYMETNQLTADDTNLLMGIGAALRRGDFKTFLDGVRPYLELAEQALGERLPADLQTQVDSGYVTEEVAQDLARNRSRVQHLEAGQRAEHERAQRAAQEQHANSIRASVTSWEAQVRRTDPDYDRKQGAVQRFARAIIAEEGVPNTPDAAVAVAKRAYDEVTATFRGARPELRPTARTPSSTHVATNAAPEPASLMEAAMLALQRTRGG